MKLSGRTQSSSGTTRTTAFLATSSSTSLAPPGTTLVDQPVVPVSTTHRWPSGENRSELEPTNLCRGSSPGFQSFQSRLGYGTAGPSGVTSAILAPKLPSGCEKQTKARPSPSWVAMPFQIIVPR